jgi:hypothetical protein
MWDSRGGVKKRYPEKTGITAIINMLIKGKVQLLSDSSLSGIIFQLNVNNEDSEYMDLSDGKFVIPVTDYVFKVACISKNPIRGSYDFGGRNKKIEYEGDFLIEAKLQQKIWIESISGGRPSLCPSIVDVLFFDNGDSSNSVGGSGSGSGSGDEEEEYASTPLTRDTSNWTTYDSAEIKEIVREQLDEDTDTDADEDIYDENNEYPGKDFLHLFSKNLEGEEKTNMESITQTFSNVFKRNKFLKMGIIVMPMINQSSTLRESILTTTNPVMSSNIKSSIISKIIRLFIDIGVIHMDLHTNNALVYLNRDGLIDTTIIDFGRASDITDGVSDKYLDSIMKLQLMERKTEFLNELETLNLTSPDSEKIRYITRVVKFMKSIMNLLNVEINNKMGPIFSYLSHSPEIGLESFNILKTTITQHQLIDPTNLTKHSVLPFEEIDQFCTEGCIYPINKPIASHYIPSSVIQGFSQKEPTTGLNEEDIRIRNMRKILRNERKKRWETQRRRIKKEKKKLHREEIEENLRFQEIMEKEREKNIEKARKKSRKKTLNKKNKSVPPTTPQLPEVNEIRKPVKTTCTGPMCVVMGGKRKTKKNKKSTFKRRKTKKRNY